ncbi:energy transducer TonB [Fusobacterium nucleatum]|uniref:energy transducer TonB n=1 Tax=Fusobacterium nucleatum TaxID=851 RepID=UPI003D089FB1
MKKYILISLVLHLIILFGFGIIQTNQLGKDEPKNEIVPIAFVAKKISENPGAKVLDTEEREKQNLESQRPKVEKKLEEKRPEKKEIESNISNKNIKPVEKQIEENSSKSDDSTTKDDNSSKNTSSKDVENEDNGFGSNFISDGDGGYIALSSKGINYQIINEVEPDYPSQAESIGYSQQVKVTVKFLVGLKGNVEKAEITQSHRDLGFDAEVMKAIKKWRFRPIYHNGKNIKVYFVKTFVFDPQ